MRQHIRTLQEKYRNLRRWEQITLALLIVAVIALIVLFTRKSESPLLNNIDENAQKEVILRSVADLSLDKEPIRLIGVVQSESQVDIRTESSGSITRVSVELGARVGRGQVIAEIENSSERASVAQAKALVNAQQAQLDNLEDSYTISGNTVSVENAYRALLSFGLVAEPDDEDSTLTAPVISGAYTGSDEGVYDIYVTHGSQSNDYEFFLKGIEQIRTTDITENELKSTQLGTLGLRISFIGDTKDYSDTRWIVRIPNEKSSSYVTNLNAYNLAVDSQEGTGDQITAQRAQVQSAEASLDAANALLAKTIIRSPISGTVNELDIDLGEFVSVSQFVATVANENKLEIKTYITEDDKKSMEVGLPVTIAREYNGFITSISPAVDSSTKKIEVSVSVDGEAELLNGQSVNLTITRKDIAQDELDQIFIPLSALKVTFEGVVVFSVDALGVVQKHIVKEGPLVGDKVLILEGLTPNMKIITDVRGISIGETVTVVN